MGNVSSLTAGLPEILFGPAALNAAGSVSFENSSYWRSILQYGNKRLAPNLATQPGLIRLEDKVFPVAVNHRISGNSYPLSLHAQYVSYPRAELSLVPSPGSRLAARLGLAILDATLRMARCDRTVQWSSWLFSTSLHHASVGVAAGVVTKALASAFPNHAIMVKNIDGCENPALPNLFAAAGYDLVTSRQVYYFDGRTRDFASKSTVKRDAKAFAAVRGVDYSVVEHETFAHSDVARITDLYRQIYLEKHTPLNPRYTDAFVEFALSEKWLEFRGLRHKSGRLDGVYGSFTMGGVTSIPFIGYDASLPQETGLYRHLVSLLLQQITERRLLLNYSSGAGDFKRRRGGKPVIEFNAIYTRHLPGHRRAAFGLLRELSNRLVRPFLEINEI